MLENLVAKARATVTDGIDLVLLFIGNGSAETVLELIKSWIPEQAAALTDEQLTAVIGFVMWYWGDRIHHRLVPFGFGVFTNGAGKLIAPMVTGILESFKKAE